MGTLGSASTITEVKAAYDDNSSYDVDDNQTACAIFIQACRILLRRLPRSAGQGGQMEIDLDLRQIREELDRARRWLTRKAAPGGGLRFSDFGDFRR